MKPAYAVKVESNIVAIFEESDAAYKLRNEKREELTADVRVDKHVIYKDLSDRERLRD